MLYSLQKQVYVFMFLIVCHETVGIYTWNSVHSLRAVLKLASALFIKGIWLTFILVNPKCVF